MTDQIAVGVIIGIVSGLVTTLLIWLITVVWSSQLVPWYEKRVYKGIQIHGSWNLEVAVDVDDPWTHWETLTLAQNAHRISGTVALTPRIDADQTPSSLTVNGEISDRVVSLALQSPLSDRLSYSVMLLEVVGNGTQMRRRIGSRLRPGCCCAAAGRRLAA